MARTRRKNRRGRTDRKNSNGPRNNLDRDDDYPMYDVENNNSPSFNQRRGRRYSNHNNNKNSNGQQNRDDRKSKNRNPFGRFTNPFEKFDLDGLTFHDEQGSRFRGNENRNRNRGDKQGHRNRNPQQHNHHHNGQRHTNATSATNNNNEGNNDTNHTRTQNRRNNRNGNRPPSSAPRSSSPARLARFCTECSTVRRANLTLRDWLGSAIMRASEVLNSWSDEVGVDRGAADEMDWQPEPVVRVLILAAAAATTGGTSITTPISTGGNRGLAQEQQQHDGGLVMGGGAAAALGANTNCNTGPWGLRPGALDPGFSMGSSNGGVWEIDDSAPGNASVWGQMNTSNSWGNPALTLQSAKMISPPETPPFSMAIT
ncbi:hypothetical protein F5B21DRAFT_232440 [Xylaria acuta]|nr:hypothetical protein F5B21DRAFT_232440 [Xylaria acuta]